MADPGGAPGSPICRLQSAVNRDLIADLARGLEEGCFDAIERLFRKSGAPSPKVVIDPSESEIRNEKLQHLLTYWTGLPKVTDLPSFEAVDPIHMRKALGYIMLLDVLDDGWDYRYRVYGCEIAKWYGKDLTGQRTSDISSGEFIPAFFIAVYRASTVLRRPILTDHVPPLNVSVTSWRRLILPLTDSSGTVARFLVGNIPGRWRPTPVEDLWMNRRQKAC